MALLHSLEGGAPASLWQLTLTRSADKAQKKLDKPLRQKLYEALLLIAKAPEKVGEKLCTPLQMLHSHHLVYQGHEFRIAYQIQHELESVIVVLIGPHENFYRKLKQLIY